MCHFFKKNDKLRKFTKLLKLSLNSHSRMIKCNY